MRVLILHNRYRTPGGEDQAVNAEAALLHARGVETLRVNTGNETASDPSFSNRARFAFSAAWSRESYRRVAKICQEFRPHVAHVHNFWMALSPSVHQACRDSGAATVQTLHNYRLLCANALLLRDGKICEDCVGKFPWRGVVRRCYHQAFLPSAAVGAMIIWNRSAGTWDRYVDAFIAPSAHARSRFIRGGLDPDRIFIKPNFVPNPPARSAAPSGSDVIVYAGRLSSEKGPHILLEAWARTQPGNRGRLLFVGDGLEAAPLQSRVEALGLSSSVQFAGRTEPAEALRIISGARTLVCPSLCAETFGNAIVEAYSVGTPVIVSRAGAFEEIVTDGHTGFTVPPGDVEALGSAVNRILSDGPLADRLGNNGRSEYLGRYTPARNYEMLMRIYESAMRRRMEAAQPPAIAMSAART